MRATLAGLLRPAAAGVAAALTLVCLAGCGDGTKSIVAGKVTCKDAPVTGGTITANSTTKSGQSYPISIQPDGTFFTADLPPGRYEVAVATDSAASSDPMPGGSPPPQGYVAPASAAKKVDIPPKYNDPKTSGILWDIKPGKNDVPVKLE